jgi:hypothetical protein
VITRLFLVLVQFSSSAEIGARGTPAGGLSKLSSADGDGFRHRPAPRRQTRGLRRSGRHLENVSLERR